MSATGRYIGELDLKPLGTDDWRVKEAFGYVTSDGQEIIVPGGFITDLASVSRWLGFFYCLFGNRCRRAAVIHDWLYRMTDTPRKRADWIFRDAARAEGEPGWVRWTMWAGVRIGGWAARKKVDGVINGTILPEGEKA